MSLPKALIRATNLNEVRSAKKERDAKRLRQSLFAGCRNACNQLGNEIAGFAVVVWGKDAELRSTYDASNGPIRASLVPTLVRDALNRHVSVMLAADYIESTAK